MTMKFRNALAALILHSPLAPRQRWTNHLSQYFPIMKNIFPESPCGLLCTLRLMDALENGNLRRTQKRVETLRRLCREGTDAEKAAWAVLAGLYYGECGNQREMARHMRFAGRMGHDYHLPHAMLCLHYIFVRHRFNLAADEADQAIDCLYKYPPLTAEGQKVIAMLYADKALALTMMHRSDEAANMLRLASAARESYHYQHAAAVLHAVQGQREAAEEALRALEKLDHVRYEHARENVPLILEGTHPHFAVIPPDADAIRTYWERFRQEESELLRLLDTEGRSAAFKLHDTFFKPLDIWPSALDLMAVGICRLEDGTPCLELVACHSRSCDALIDAMLAACPEDLKARWHFTRKP